MFSTITEILKKNIDILEIKVFTSQYFKQKV